MGSSKKIKSIKDIFTYVKFKPMVEDFTDIKPGGGISHRLNGKSTNGKPQELTTEEKAGLSEGLEKMYSEIKEVLK